MRGDSLDDEEAEVALNLTCIPFQVTCHSCRSHTDAGINTNQHSHKSYHPGLATFALPCNSKPTIFSAATNRPFHWTKVLISNTYSRSTFWFNCAFRLKVRQVYAGPNRVDLPEGHSMAFPCMEVSSSKPSEFDTDLIFLKIPDWCSSYSEDWVFFPKAGSTNDGHPFSLFPTLGYHWMGSENKIEIHCSPPSIDDLSNLFWNTDKPNKESNKGCAHTAPERLSLPLMAICSCSFHFPLGWSCWRHDCAWFLFEQRWKCCVCLR